MKNQKDMEPLGLGRGYKSVRVQRPQKCLRHVQCF